ncbi:DUF916 and DUF3324 domain-containing protein [Carnobacterium maltaromaticum]|uniref:DUF916 and DUF3324 domain-containing protein n=1 Tax=Carnobacterium maltaromaticum TaxID=2751 RepID=UPI0012F8FFE6|nr:DUF916 and DUF3324 domain-containing protein [Carnobacterium maltaromaticum]
MKKIMKTWLVSLFLLGAGLAPVRDIRASNAPSFSVTPILPDNQQGGIKSYFNLRMMPSQEQTIEVELVNAGEKAVEVMIENVTAQSNQNGIIDYSKSSERLDKSLFILFPEISNVEKSVTLSPKEKKVIPINIKLPDLKFDGVVLGGLNFSEKVEGNEEESQQIGNRFSYSIAVMISQTDARVVPELDLLDVKAEQENYRNVITARVQNNQAVIVEEMNVDGEIFKEGYEEPVFTRKASGLKMAPNSFLPFNFDTNNQALQAGDYRLKMTAKIGDETWTWDEKFRIDNKTANALNESAVGIEQNDYSLYFWIAGVLLLLILFFSALIFRYKKEQKRKKELEKKRRQRRKHEQKRKRNPQKGLDSNSKR